MIRGLQPSMTYQFHVVAQNSRGTSAPSEVLQVTTLIEANVPGAPMNLEGHATSSMSITLSWEEPQVINGRISKYIITFMEVYKHVLQVVDVELISRVTSYPMFNFLVFRAMVKR